MKAFAWIEPSSLPGAIEAGAAKGALYKAGGVDVGDRLKEHLEEPVALVNIRRLGDLGAAIAVDDTGMVRMGPLVTLAQIAAHPRLREKAPALADAAAAAATPQIRNVATLGGNLAQRPRCWYFRKEQFHCRRKGGSECFAIDGQNEMHAVFDNDLCAIVHPSALATALTALGATLELKGPKGGRRVAIDDFFVRPETDLQRENVLQHGELITGVSVRARPSAYVKLMEKQSFDWPLAEAAVALGDEPRVVLGAAAPVPWRATRAEALIKGRRIDAALAAQAAKAALEGAKPLQHNQYKLALLEAAVKRALLAAGGAA